MNPYTQKTASRSTDGKALVGAFTNQPYNPAFCIADNLLATLLEDSTLAIGKIIAYQSAPLHAEWLETVAGLHTTNSQRKRNLVSIKGSYVGRLAYFNNVGELYMVFMSLMTIDAWFRNCQGSGLFTTLFNDQPATVESQLMGRRLEHTPGLCMQMVIYLFYLLRCESLGSEQFIKQVFGCWLLQKPENIDDTISRQTRDGLTHRYIKDALYIGHTAGCLGNVGRSGGIDLPEQWQYFKSQLVSNDIGHEIGAVCNVGLPRLLKILFDLGTADTQQWAYDMSVTGTDACQAMNARTPHEVHEEGLYGVVLMMGYTDLNGSNVTT